MKNHVTKDMGSSLYGVKPKMLHKKGQTKTEYFTLESAIWSHRILSPVNVGLFIVTLLVYFNSLNGNFVHDDMFAIKRNEDVTGQRPWYYVFRNDFWGKSMADNTSHKSYRPLTVITFQMNYWLGGGEPYTFHIVNFVLHLSVIYLLSYICEWLFHLPSNSAQMVGLFFAVHPVHSEAVAGIVGRAELLAAVFFLLAFMFYARGVQAEYDNPGFSSLQIYISFILGASSMFCKETGITVLGICIVYDSLIFYQRFSWSNTHVIPAFVQRILKLLLTITVLLLFRMWIMVNTLPVFKEEDNPAAFSPHFLTRFLTYSHLCAWNGYLLLLPVTLCYDWQVNTIQLIGTCSDPRNAFTVAFFLVLICIAKRSFQNKNDCTVLMGLAFLIIPFLPASNLFFPVGFVIAERVLYIPSIGYSILVVHGLNLLKQRFHRYSKKILAVFLFVCFVLSIKTWYQNQTWHSRQSLFLSGLKALPHNAKIHFNLANLLKDKGQIDSAIYHYEKVLRLWPKHASSHNNLGNLLTDKKQARYHYEKALEISPQLTSALINLGVLLHQDGDTTQAIQLMKKAVKFSPPNAQLFLTLGNLLAENKQMDEAEKLFEAAISMKPNYADAYNYYGSFYQKKGDIKKALEFYHKAVEQDSQHTRAMINAARSLEHLQQYDEAETMLLRALSVQHTPLIMDRLGMFYLHRGQVKKSLNVFQQILSETHSELNNTDVILHYAQVLAESHKMTEAKTVLLQIVQGQSSSTKTKAVILLSRLYGMQKQHKDAIDLLTNTIYTHQGPAEELTELLYERGNHQRDSEQYMDALSSYKESLRIGKQKDGKVEFNIGTVYHLLENCKEARNYYSKAAKLDPDNEDILINLRKLRNIEQQQRRKNS